MLWIEKVEKLMIYEPYYVSMCHWSPQILIIKFNSNLNLKHRNLQRELAALISEYLNRLLTFNSEVRTKIKTYSLYKRNIFDTRRDSWDIKRSSQQMSLINYCSNIWTRLVPERKLLRVRVAIFSRNSDTRVFLFETVSFDVMKVSPGRSTF